MTFGASAARAASTRRRLPGRRRARTCRDRRRLRDRARSPRAAPMRRAGHGEAEMEARGIADRRVAARDVDMNGVGRLDIGEGRDDDPPDALDRVERQRPRWRSTIARIIEASRAGRNAEPPPWRVLIVDQRSMMRPRSISSACIAASIRSISTRRSARLAAAVGHGRPSPFERLGGGNSVMPRGRGSRLRCSSTRRNSRWSWSRAACRAGTRSRRPCPSD